MLAMSRERESPRTSGACLAGLLTASGSGDCVFADLSSGIEEVVSGASALACGAVSWWPWEAQSARPVLRQPQGLLLPAPIVEHSAECRTDYPPNWADQKWVGSPDRLPLCSVLVSVIGRRVGPSLHNGSDAILP